jgi:glycosyltransferase involved in cell wall biosynthesis
MRVLLVSHTCQSRTEGQPRAQCLGRIPDVELRLLTPDRWLHYGKWRQPETPISPSFDFEVGKVTWPWVGPGQFYLHWYPGLAKTLKEFQPDIIDLWEENWSLVSVQACQLRNRLVPHAKIVAETEQNVSKKLPPPFEQFRSYTLQHADFVVARNSEAVDLVKSKGYTGPAEVVPNAVDIELFRPLDRAACRASLELSGFVVGYVGRMVEEKGLMDVVEALPLCSEEVQLLFVGSGPYQEALENRVKELGKSAQVRFLPGQPLEELPAVMNAIDTLVLPSRTTGRWKEQFGRVIIEAHACQTPVIGSDSGAIPDVVGAGGLVVPERNPAALAAAMMQLKQNPSQRIEMGKAGRVQVEEHYTWEQVAKRMHNIYSRLLEKTPNSVTS